ncbi:MAG: type II toxin-antitoxin system VapC family toxin [Solirubrobacterales bacterium]
MPVIEVVSDANVALKWFHAEGEEEVGEARALLDAHKARTVALSVLDLTPYEVGNALMRGRAAVDAEQVATVLEALAEICPALQPRPEELRRATELAARHELTLYDAAYAAVAENRNASLATLDRALLEAGLGTRPSELAARLAEEGVAPGGGGSR